MTAPKDLTVLRDYLRAQGLKLTRPRRIVMEKLLATHKHVSADELLDMLRRDKRPVSKASVYRTLAILRRSGLVDGHDFDSGRRVYEPMVGRTHHDHLYCIRCGAVIEFEEPRIEELQDEVVRRHRFTPVYHSHKIFGYCQQCRGKAGGPAHA